MPDLSIQSLFCYPVKSCAPVSISSGLLTASGFINDRRWMVVESATGKFISQRNHPVLARIEVQMYLDNNEPVLNLSFLSNSKPSSIEVNISRSTLIETEVWGDSQRCWDQGDQVANWFSEIVGVSVRLAYIDNDQLRTVDQEFAVSTTNKVGFADGFPFLVATSSSIEKFNQDLGYDIDISRFRPNIVVSGDGLAPYSEDKWNGIRVNGVEYTFVKPCSRCVMPSINPMSLDKERSVIDTLVATRKVDNKTYFGQNAIHSVDEGVVSVGDLVEFF